MLLCLSVIIHIQADVPLVLCLEGEGPQHGIHILRPQFGGVEEEDLTTYGQFLDPMLNN